MPAQRRSRIKREALLWAGLELFELNGYEATAIGAIAARAKVAVGSFYQYFRSKRQLLLVLMNELLRKLEQIDMRPQHGDLRDRIESVLRAGVMTDLGYAGAYRAWKEAMLANAKLAALDEQMRAWTTARLRMVFGLLQQLPGARTGMDVLHVHGRDGSSFLGAFGQQARVYFGSGRDAGAYYLPLTISGLCGRLKRAIAAEATARKTARGAGERRLSAAGHLASNSLLLLVSD